MSGATLMAVFDRLLARFGPLHWWPAETPFEVVVGAILTQNTAWTNVEKAIANLRAAETLTPAKLAPLPRAELEMLIRPAGFFRQKAERLQAFARHLLDVHDGDVLALCDGPLEQARSLLLGHRGVGPETADSILLYAAGRPTFVVDAYTRRLFTRLDLLQGDEPYEAIRAWFMAALPHDADLFNEFHALIVQVCKSHCRKHRPLCAACPLKGICAWGKGEA